MDKFKPNQSVRIKDNAKEKYFMIGEYTGGIWIERKLDKDYYRVYNGGYSFSIREDDLENDPNVKDINYF